MVQRKYAIRTRVPSTQCTKWQTAPHLNTVQDGRVEDVDTGIDAVSDKLDWLLDETVDAARVWHADDYTVLAWLVDLCDHDGTLCLVCEVEVSEGLEGVGADDIRVEDKEGAVILCEDFARQC